MRNLRKAFLFITFALLFGLSVLTMTDCGSDNGTGDGSDDIVGPQPDTIPPAAVTDLRLRSPSPSSVAVVWTSPGDDGLKGTASEYDIRHSTSLITEENWGQATPVDKKNLPSPKPSGSIETTVVLGLASGATFYFALKASDEKSNWSNLSNCASGQTLGEVIPPGEITDLVASASDDTSFELEFTAPGDDGMVGQAAEYDIRYSMAPIDDEDSWGEATQVNGEPPPGPAGETEYVIVEGVPFRTTLFFAVRTADELQNWSGFSNPAVGLANGVTFCLMPKNLTRGENLYIIFETSTPDTLTLTTNRLYVPYVCNRGLIEVIESKPYPDGVHVVTFDFFNESTGEYYPENYYRIGLCQGEIALEHDSVNFEY
ncbi:MAG: hypothetical protein JSW58_13505 [Candidatus Latescibacterota bacterium]|nr:MAG: hypothetical protein JSW58_13505 [Candidatus Latescibacterota bacterium]